VLRIITHVPLWTNLIRSLEGSSYIIIIVNDYSRFTWVIILKDKLEALKEFVKLGKILKISKKLLEAAIRTDHGGQFDQDKFINYCDKNDILHNFLAPRTP